jgi:hypothetical protein
MEGSMKFNLGAGFSKIIFSTLKSKSKLEIDFNLVAFAIIYWIDKLMTKVKEEIEIREINSIGN